MMASTRPVAQIDAEFTQLLSDMVGGELDSALLTRAVTHRSFSYENGNVPHNERLEFLGDSVLGLIITDHLYAEHPDVSEGQLAKLRASVVNMRALASVARTLGVGPHLLLGKGEAATGGHDKDSILADSLEAIIGAIYLCAGIPGAGRLIHQVFDPLMALSATLGAALDWKTSLQEASSAAALGVPQYRVRETGPDHAKEFTAQVVLTDEVYGEGVGSTKKVAEQAAAEQAWNRISQLQGSTQPPQTAG